MKWNRMEAKKTRWGIFFCLKYFSAEQFFCTFNTATKRSSSNYGLRIAYGSSRDLWGSGAIIANGIIAHKHTNYNWCSKCL